MPGREQRRNTKKSVKEREKSERKIEAPFHSADVAIALDSIPCWNKPGRAISKMFGTVETSRRKNWSGEGKNASWVRRRLCFNLWGFLLGRRGRTTKKKSQTEVRALAS